ncbi:MAG: hypothetical protein ACLVG5_02150 [Clostridium sp.]
MESLMDRQRRMVRTWHPFNDEELKILAETKIGVAHCPISNMKLSSDLSYPGNAEAWNSVDWQLTEAPAMTAQSSGRAPCRLSSQAEFQHQAPDGYELLKLATRESAVLAAVISVHWSRVKYDLFLIRKNRLELVGADWIKSMLGTVDLRAL